jgi:hypothetical protein
MTDILLKENFEVEEEETMEFQWFEFQEEYELWMEHIHS